MRIRHASSDAKAPTLWFFALCGLLTAGAPSFAAPAAPKPTTAPRAVPKAATSKPAVAGAKSSEPADAANGLPAKGKPWPVLSDDEQAAAVKQRKLFADAVAEKMSIKLALKETRYFLFYTNLPDQEATNWSGLLDRMYDRLAELFAVAREKGAYRNIWRGKAVIFVFTEAKDYHHFQTLFGLSGDDTTAGMCFSYSNGDVHVGFYRQPKELDFAHVLVHESVHGFIHRFKSPANVPSWANEGLAEVIASELVPRPDRKGQSELLAQSGVQNDARPPNTLGGNFYTASHIVAWQYPVAKTLSAFMIAQSKARYVAFINGIKEGLTWEESLAKKYGVTVERLTAAYGDSIRVRDLKP